MMSVAFGIAFAFFLEEFSAVDPLETLRKMNTASACWAAFDVLWQSIAADGDAFSTEVQSIYFPKSSLPFLLD